MHDLQSYLTSSKGEVSAEDLKMFGIQASRAYLNKEGSLNDAIYEISRDNELNPYQIQRVCEFANNSAFKALFEKNASKIIEFPVADSTEIKEKLAKKPDRPSPASMPDCPGYTPGQESVPDLGKALFGKTAEADDYRDYNGELVRMWQAVEGQRQHKESDLISSERKVKEAANKFYCEVRRFITMEEGTLGDVMDAVKSHAPGPGFLKVAMSSVVSELFDAGVLTKEAVGKESPHTRRPDPEHPVVNSFIEFTKTASDIRAQYKVVNSLRDEESKLKKAAVTLKTSKGNLLPPFKVEKMKGWGSEPKSSKRITKATP